MDQNLAVRRGASSGARFALTKFRVPMLPGTLVTRSVLHHRLLTLRRISDNFAACIVLQIRRPIAVGDLVACDG